MRRKWYTILTLIAVLMASTIAISLGNKETVPGQNKDECAGDCQSCVDGICQDELTPDEETTASNQDVSISASSGAVKCNIDDDCQDPANPWCIKGKCVRDHPDECGQCPPEKPICMIDQCYPCSKSDQCGFPHECENGQCVLPFGMCVQKDDCPKPDEVCNNFFCGCPENKQYSISPGVCKACLDKGDSCSSDIQCCKGLPCVNGQCGAPSCKKDKDCPLESPICTNEVCGPCTTHLQCASERGLWPWDHPFCDNGECVDLIGCIIPGPATSSSSVSSSATSLSATPYECSPGVCKDCCETGDFCSDDSACCSGFSCLLNTCVPTAPTCSDGVKNGDETDVDCGGGNCPQCGDGKSCSLASDCASGVCTDGTCVPVCLNLGDNCTLNSECCSGSCVDGVCTGPVPTCFDGVTNGDETDVDCGGGNCPQCGDGKLCSLASDCASGVCTDGTCVPVCLNLGDNCTLNSECCSGICENSECIPSGGEGLPLGAYCNLNDQCASGWCKSWACSSPCTSDSECPEGVPFCYTGGCAASCVQDVQCDSTRPYCIDGQCQEESGLPNGAYCTLDSSCSSGWCPMYHCSRHCTSDGECPDSIPYCSFENGYGHCVA
jgi:hypothetical protein